MSNEERPGLKRTHDSLKKREDYISWEEFFMGVAILASQRSKDPDTQVGACIVNKNNVIVGIGYNGLPKNCNDDDFPWNKKSKPDSNKNHKLLYVCHAEINAILNKNCCNINGCKIYTTLFPCNECAKCIIQSGITEVIYKNEVDREKKKYEASMALLTAAKIKFR